MFSYNLAKTANQSFNTNIGDNNFAFEFYTFRGVMRMSVRINGEYACIGEVAIPNTPLFSGRVSKTAGGVFMFRCRTDDYPHFTNFNDLDCSFTFTPYEEL